MRFGFDTARHTRCAHLQKKRACRCSGSGRGRAEVWVSVQGIGVAFPPFACCSASP